MTRSGSSPTGRTAPLGARRPPSSGGWRRILSLPASVALTLGLGVGLGVATALPAQAAGTGWADFTFTGTSRDYHGTMTQQPTGFPVARYLTNSVSGTSVGRQNGSSTFLPAISDPGKVYGSSAGRPYLNLRPNNQSGPPPSETTYTFARPTPSSGWTFVLGDIDADQVTVTATGPGGIVVPAADLGYQTSFNYAKGNDTPVWDESTSTLTGNSGATDTDGASGWFEPKVPLTTLTFSFSRRAGFPVFQTWFGAQAHTLSGTIDAPAGKADGIVVRLFDPEGFPVAQTTTRDGGKYAFPDLATYDAYQVAVVAPTGLTSDQPLDKVVDLSRIDRTADFSLRAVHGVTASGTVTDGDRLPVEGVPITLTGPAGTTSSTKTDGAGNYTFDGLAPGDWAARATAPDGTVVSPPKAFVVPPDSENAITGLDFTITPRPIGAVTGTVTEQGVGAVGQVTVRVTGPQGVSLAATTGTDGRWGLPDLPPGDYTAVVEPPYGSEPVGAQTLRFTISSRGGLVSGQDFELKKIALLTASGTVADTAGRPVAGVEVTITSSDGILVGEAKTDSAGNWSQVGLLPDLGYRASISVPDGYHTAGPTSRSFDVVSVNVAGIDFLLRAPTSPSPTSGPTTGPTSGPTSGPSTGPITTSPTAPGSTGPAATGSAQASGGLASTGGPSAAVGLVGVLVMVSGAAALIAARRSRRQR